MTGTDAADTNDPETNFVTHDLNLFFLFVAAKTLLKLNIQPELLQRKIFTVIITEKGSFSLFYRHFAVQEGMYADVWHGYFAGLRFFLQGLTPPPLSRLGVCFFEQAVCGRLEWMRFGVG
ncbi:MAG: hypothetical protein IJW35_06740 [Lentisphaeria bacterium]|nr:hypothetical protein [Lentisphaeria bacterium]